MGRITHRELTLLAECGHALLEAADDHELADAVVHEWLPKLISADWYTYQEFEHNRPIRVVLRPSATHEYQRLVPQFAAFLHQHPCYQQHTAGRSAAPLKISDFLSRRQFHRLALYGEVYRALEVEFQITTTLLPGPNRVVGIVLSRSARDFSERDRVVLGLLQPHLQEALTGVSRRAQMRQLSRREVEVLTWTGEGKSNAEMGVILSISPRTVQKHLERIFEKLGLESRVSAALFARDAGLRP